MSHILIINPNSSEVITEGLKASLTKPYIPWEVSFDFYTAPSHAPPAITDTTTAVLTASACWEDIRSRGLIDKYDGFLVCCCECKFEPPLLQALISLLSPTILSRTSYGHHFLPANARQAYSKARSLMLSLSLIVLVSSLLAQLTSTAFTTVCVHI